MDIWLQRTQPVELWTFKLKRGVSEMIREMIRGMGHERPLICSFLFLPLEGDFVQYILHDGNTLPSVPNSMARIIDIGL